jgi:hypothetical protein
MIIKRPFLTAVHNFAEEAGVPVQTMLRAATESIAWEDTVTAASAVCAEHLLLDPYAAL